MEFKDGVARVAVHPGDRGDEGVHRQRRRVLWLVGRERLTSTTSPARTYVPEYDPAAYAAALKKKAVEVGDTYVITDPNQARSYLEDRYAWSRLREESDDVCAVYETKRGRRESQVQR